LIILDRVYRFAAAEPALRIESDRKSSSVSASVNNLALAKGWYGPVEREIAHMNVALAVDGNAGIVSSKQQMGSISGDLGCG
jgi:hypothetical protein